jgi:hypothetical protein
MQDEWYQAVQPADICQVLARGAVWSSKANGNGTLRWSLSGRELFVLGPRDGLNGYVMAPRLLLGEVHVVLCTRRMVEAVRRAIADTGSPAPEELVWEAGATGGWVALGGVTPHRTIAPSAEGDILDALRPDTSAALTLSGGIRLTRSAWLTGYPPAIRIRGDAATAGTVYLDGEPCTATENGAHIGPGWDTLGDHVVSCLAGTKSYQVVAGLETWQPWDAYVWSAGDGNSQKEVRPAICGMLVRPPCEGRAAGRLFMAPPSNTLLLGAVPGQVYSCESRPDLRAWTCAGYPPFEPVWALPPEPLRCDKSVCRVLRVGLLIPLVAETKQLTRKQDRLLYAWAGAVLEASRKGLGLEPADEATAALWKAYRQEARSIWRRLR